MSGNSYGFEPCSYLAKEIYSKNAPNLTTINFSNIFVSRLRAELPASLQVMAEALLDKKIVELDLSDNAFGPDGIKAFECILKSMSSLKRLRVNNCGLGPEGGEMIAEALKENKSLKLEEFSAGRDRLENKGITALAEVFNSMGSLKVVNVPQNGIKDEGMSNLVAGLRSCEQLSELRVNDNWIKTGATKFLIEVIIKGAK